jgi:WD40 repeat protein
LKVWRLSSDNSSATCVATLCMGHIHCVAFHPTASLLAIGNGYTVKLWRLSSDNSSVTCVATLEGYGVNSVAFHPTTHLLASGRDDSTVKVWRLSSATCEETLEGHIDRVISIVDKFISVVDTLPSDNSSATCEETLEGHTDGVISVVFHPTAPLLATSSRDGTVKLWC